MAAIGRSGSSLIEDIEHRRREVSIEEVQQCLVELGRIGREKDSDYDSFMRTLTRCYPVFQQDVATYNQSVFRGYEVIVIRSSFGLTFSGIKAVLKRKQIQVDVLHELSTLRDYFIRLVDRSEMCACVVDHGVFTMKYQSFHAVSLLIRRTGDSVVVVDLDSEGQKGYSHYSLKKIKKLFPGVKSINLFVSGVVRQHAFATCNVFAINDCIAAQNHPDLIDHILKENGLSLKDENCIQLLGRLPEGLMEANEVEKALEYQALLFDGK